MYVIGAAYVDLNVGGRIVESEILITPDIGGLILRINWLRQQGCFQWDFEKDQIRFGKEEWIELRQKTNSIRRIRPELSDIEEESEPLKLSTECESNCVSVLNEHSVCTNNANSISTSNPVRGRSSPNFDHNSSSYKVPKYFRQTTVICGSKKLQAESGNVIRLTVTQGSFVSPCGIQETVIVLKCFTVKVVAPWKTGSSCSVLWGRQISAIAVSYTHLTLPTKRIV